MRLGVDVLVAAVAGLALGASSGSAESDPVSSRLGLAEAVDQALASNLDLATRERSLAAGREGVGIARSALLPQIGVGARAQMLDSERSDSERGNSPERSVNVAAGVEQILYDETSWANYRVEQHSYEEQAKQLEAFRLSVVGDVASAFLEVQRGRDLASLQEANRALTVGNLETTRARVATGYSSERELLRWKSQLAANDQSVVQAQTSALVSLFELNRVRSRPREEARDLEPLTLARHGFVYARPALADSIVDPDSDRRLRDVLVRVGLRRSPTIASIDAAIAAEERLVTANKRAFWVPTVTLSAGVDYLADSGNASDAFQNFEATEWLVRGGLAFPLFEGGAKFSRLRQSRDLLSSLRFSRRSAAETVEADIRTAFAQASGSFLMIGMAARQEAAARRNYEFVDEAYGLGVASILDLLDAQAQLITAQTGAVEARYDFFADLFSAEQALALYPFMEPASAEKKELDRIQAAIARQ